MIKPVLFTDTSSNLERNLFCFNIQCHSSHVLYISYIHTVFQDIGLARHRVQWHDPKDRFNHVRHDFFNFDGVPYLTVGTYHMTCQYGAPDSNDVLKRRSEKRVSNYSLHMMFHNNLHVFFYLHLLAFWMQTRVLLRPLVEKKSRDFIRNWWFFFWKQTRVSQHSLDWKKCSGIFFSETYDTYLHDVVRTLYRRWNNVVYIQGLSIKCTWEQLV